MPTRSFKYLADPVCIASLALYALNRFCLKPHHIGGWLTHGYLNDVLCLPLFLPMILRIQIFLRLRTHDDRPHLWEILQHWLIFSFLFEALLPRFPHSFDSTADPWDVLAYLAGGLIAYAVWHCPARAQHTSLMRALKRLLRRPLLPSAHTEILPQAPPTPP